MFVKIYQFTGSSREFTKVLEDVHQKVLGGLNGLPDLRDIHLLENPNSGQVVLLTHWDSKRNWKLADKVVSKSKFAGTSQEFEEAVFRF